MPDNTEALPPLPDICSISKPLADFPEPVAYINMKTGQVKSLATLNREKPPGQWWPFNLQEQIWESSAALAQRQQVPEELLLLGHDKIMSILSREIGYDGGLQSVNESDLFNVASAIEAAALALNYGEFATAAHPAQPSEPSAPQAAELPEDWLHLKQYGYAPGGYMSKCHRCGATPIMDKRAVTCRPCAEAMHKAAQAQPQEPPRSAPLTEEQILQVKDRILNTVIAKGESPELLRSAIAHRVVSLLRGISTPEEQR